MVDETAQLPSSARKKALISVRAKFRAEMRGGERDSFYQTVAPDGTQPDERKPWLSGPVERGWFLDEGSFFLYLHVKILIIIR
jgi:hypothetical protein